MVGQDANFVHNISTVLCYTHNRIDIYINHYINQQRVNNLRSVYNRENYIKEYYQNQGKRFFIKYPGLCFLYVCIKHSLSITQISYKYMYVVWKSPYHMNQTGQGITIKGFHLYLTPLRFIKDVKTPTVDKWMYDLLCIILCYVWRWKHGFSLHSHIWSNGCQ